MTGATVSTTAETIGGDGVARALEVVMRAETDTLTTGDAVGVSPFSATGVEGEVEGEEVGVCTSIAALSVEIACPVTRDP